MTIKSDQMRAGGGFVTSGRIAAVFLTWISIGGDCQAALEADFVTTRGTITVQLEYGKAPKAVASLVTLAEGSRSWVDSRNGAVRRAPFHNGLQVYGAINHSSVRLFETGSRNGGGTDDAGYAFQDEFDPSLTHTPYVLAMSNNGPNTNGSRIYFTGNLSLPARDNRHTVFGKVPGAPGRTVIDSIIAAGAGATTITSISIRRTDPAALAFDEKLVSLPVVQAVNGPLEVHPGTSASLLFSQPKLSVFRASASPDLLAWQPAVRGFVGIDDAVPQANRQIDNAPTASRFYHFSLARYPDFPVPGGVSHLSNRILQIDGTQIGTLIYHFDATGLAGTYENIVFPGDPPFFSGPFQVRTEIPAVLDPYSFRILLHANGLGGAPFNLIRGGIDNVGTSTVTGRHETSLYSETMMPIFDDSGTLQLSRP